MTAKSPLKAIAKRLAYSTGVLSQLRRSVHRDKLVVPLFHRVLPETDPRFATADPAYTLKLGTFERCLDALRGWYQPVSLSVVETALKGNGRLPQRAMLVTFDDGWEDTARYAVPAMQARDIPSAIFIATNGLECATTLWRDVARSAWQGGMLGPQSLDAVLGDLAAMKSEDRQILLQSALDKSGDKIAPVMMSPTDVSTLGAMGAQVGSHGATHEPLTTVSDLAAELGRSASHLHALTGAAPRCLSFPHGLHQAREREAAKVAGFDLLFTSERAVNPMNDGRLSSPVIGRIEIGESDITDSAGSFRPELLSLWLTQQPVLKPSAFA